MTEKSNSWKLGYALSALNNIEYALKYKQDYGDLVEEIEKEINKVKLEVGWVHG